jgi:hypothetical protein
MLQECQAAATLARKSGSQGSDVGPQFGSTATHLYASKELLTEIRSIPNC